MHKDKICIEYEILCDMSIVVIFDVRHRSEPVSDPAAVCYALHPLLHVALSNHVRGLRQTTGLTSISNRPINQIKLGERSTPLTQPLHIPHLTRTHDTPHFPPSAIA